MVDPFSIDWTKDPEPLEAGYSHLQTSIIDESKDVPQVAPTFKHISARMAGIATALYDLLTSEWQSKRPNINRWKPSIGMVRDATQALAPSEFDNEFMVKELRKEANELQKRIQGVQSNDPQRIIFDVLLSANYYRGAADAWAKIHAEEPVALHPTLLTHQSLLQQADPHLQNLALNQHLQNDEDTIHACHELHTHAAIAHLLYPLQYDTYADVALDALQRACKRNNGKPVGKTINVYRESFKKFIDTSKELEQ